MTLAHDLRLGRPAPGRGLGGAPAHGDRAAAADAGAHRRGRAGGRRPLRRARRRAHLGDPGAGRRLRAHGPRSGPDPGGGPLGGCGRGHALRLRPPGHPLHPNSF